ncbi:MAG TPA: hypothetical protein VHC22_27635 [Pirellulales bacterium]|nr:hypothetical protein [Pirellulales bacterium]
MPDDVLLVVNCQHEYCYANRHLLRELYSQNFANLVFAVSPLFELDPSYDHVVATWQCDPHKNRCTCIAPFYGEHSANVHCFHTRLLDVAKVADEAQFVVFVEDDCLLAPRMNPATIANLCAGFDALLPPVWLLPRDNTSWIWTRHDTGYPAFDAVAAGFDRQRLLSNWREYSGTEPPDVSYVPLMSAFVDAFVLRTDLLERMIDDLTRMREVWHEASIPTAVLHQTSRIGRLNGLALWGEERNRGMHELVGLLSAQDFVHPIKLSNYPTDEILSAYRALVRS